MADMEEINKAVRDAEEMAAESDRAARTIRRFIAGDGSLNELRDAAETVDSLKTRARVAHGALKAIRHAERRMQSV